jgi:putative transcriptional regulator
MVEIMSEIFDCIKQDLEQTVAYSKSKWPKAVVHEFSPIDIKNMRAKMGMSQNEFASVFGINVCTLRHWERGDRVPHGPALVLLNVVKNEPQAILKALTD